MDLSKLINNQYARYAEHVIAIGAITYLLYRAKDIKLSSVIKSIPGAQAALENQMDKEAEKAVKDMFKKIDQGTLEFLEIPASGQDKTTILEEMRRLSKTNVDMHSGKGFAYVYDTNDDEYWDYIQQAFLIYMKDNALNPVAFPALRKFEVEVVKMTAKLHHGDHDVVGTMTSGGTESILCALKAYRERAREQYPHIKNPEVLLPITAHPAFEKGGHLFDLKMVHVPLKGDLKVDVNIMEKMITPNTILLVGSAPQYPHGVVDPIEEIGKLGVRKGIPVHVDACVGGFLLPWIERLGRAVPLWDWRCAGVTSISADLHKYGYATKGASVITYKNQSYRKYQFFSYSGWPGGLFTSPSLLGTRPGGCVAAAWATLVGLGESGYVKLAAQLMSTTDKVIQRINATKDLKVHGVPEACLVAIISTNPEINILGVADVMEDEYGWKMERQTSPNAIHLSIMPPHAKCIDKFMDELEASIEVVRKNPQLNNSGTAAMYGTVAKIPDGAIVETFLTSFMGKVYNSLNDIHQEQK